MLSTKFFQQLIYKAVEIDALHSTILYVLLFDSAGLKDLCAWVLRHCCDMSWSCIYIDRFNL